MDDDWVIGVDLGATKTACGLVSADHRLIACDKVDTKPLEGPQAAVERIAPLIQCLIQKVPAGTQVTHIGVCTPGPVDHLTGTIIDPPNLTGWRQVPFASLLSQKTGLPVKLEHDAKATALAEFHFGAGRGARDMVLMIVGTGIGAAVILDGKLYRGRTNAAGEVGHISVDLNGPICSCGSNGCVETYAGGPAIMRAYSYATRREISTAQEVVSAAEAGDPIARRVFQIAGRALGAAIATMAMLFDVEVFVMFGGVIKAKDYLLAPAREAVPNYSHRSISPRVKVLTAELGDDAGLLGAAWIANHSV
jgi:glucokinase